MRLIDADNLIKDIQTEIAISKHRYEDIGCRCFRRGMDRAIRIARQQPTVAPIKHGHWIFAEDMVSYIKCSECGDNICWVNTKRPKYCPSCGAKMDGDAND